MKRTFILGLLIVLPFISVLGISSIYGRSFIPAPYNLYATSDSTTITLHWQYSGSTVSQFVIYASSNNATFIQYGTTSDGSTFTWVDTSPPNDVVMYYYVKGYTFLPSEFSNPSNTVNSIIPTRIPDVPTITGTAGNTNNYMSWLFNGYCSGGNPLTSIKIYRSDYDNHSEFLLHTLSYPIPTVNFDTSFTDVGYLANGQNYYYRIGFVNSIGEHISSQFLLIPNYYSIVPNAPSITDISHDFRQIQFDIYSGGSNGGFPVQYYNITRSTDNIHFNSIANSSYLGTFTDTTVINNQTYYYQVKSVNTIGESSVSNTLSDTPYGYPTVPVDFQLSVVSNILQVHLQWNTSVDNGGYAIFTYRIYRGIVNTTLLFLTNVSTTSYIDSNVTFGQRYYYLIVAVTSFGMSNPTSILSIMPNGVSLCPLNVRADIYWDHSSIFVSWGYPSNDGGSSVLTYRIYRSFDNNTFAYFDTTTNTSYRDAQCQVNQRYYYRITTINSNGESGYSAIVSNILSPIETTTTTPTTTNTETFVPNYPLYVGLTIGVVVVCVGLVYAIVRSFKHKSFYA